MDSVGAIKSAELTEIAHLKEKLKILQDENDTLNKKNAQLCAEMGMLRLHNNTLQCLGESMSSSKEHNAVLLNLQNENNHLKDQLKYMQEKYFKLGTFYESLKESADISQKWIDIKMRRIYMLEENMTVTVEGMRRIEAEKYDLELKLCAANKQILSLHEEVQHLCSKMHNLQEEVNTLQDERCKDKNHWKHKYELSEQHKSQALMLVEMWQQKAHSCEHHKTKLLKWIKIMEQDNDIELNIHQ